MIIVMKRDATEEQVQAVIDKLLFQEYDVHRSTGEERTVLGVVGTRRTEPEEYKNLAGVKEVIRISKG